MNTKDFEAFMESDEVMEGFITAILLSKAESYAYIKGALSLDEFSSNKVLYHDIAEQWLTTYFDEYGDKDTETMMNLIKYHLGHNTIFKPRITNGSIHLRKAK